MQIVDFYGLSLIVNIALVTIFLIPIRKNCPMNESIQRKESGFWERNCFKDRIGHLNYITGHFFDMVVEGEDKVY